MKPLSAQEYMQIDAANHFGLDKEDWEVRLDWFQQHEHELESLVAKAEVPQLYYASISAYRKAQRGEAIGYPIGLDGTASGLQLLSCLTGDEQAARLCNVISTGHREDAYTNLHIAIEQALGGSYHVTRADAKQAIN